MRPCGECTVCCTTMRVDSIGKATGEPCKALRTDGCAIYAKRPKECKTFQCIWSLGKLPDDHRPDLLGILFHNLGESNLRREIYKRFNATVYVARELVPGAFEQNEFLLTTLARSHLIMLIFIDGRRANMGNLELMSFVRAHTKKP
jgi:hypothetical protein